MILSYPSFIVESMDCYCDACLEDLTTPPIDYLDPIDVIYDMAAEACWGDMADDPRDLIDRWDYV